jgi:acyl-CoA thioesterase-1
VKFYFKIALAAFLLAALQFDSATAQSKLIKNLEAGKPQVLVTYGTSLTAATGGKAWVAEVNNTLNKKYNGFVNHR